MDRVIGYTNTVGDWETKMVVVDGKELKRMDAVDYISKVLEIDYREALIYVRSLPKAKN